jgi:geranylgeranyl pyrophosphate synthase
LRPAVAFLVGDIAAAPAEPILYLAAAVETLHAATLVHDDLIDQSLLRRGHPTLNASLSAETTVLAGDYLFARSAAFAARTNSPRVVQIFSDCLMTICGGELGQLAQRGRVPTRDEYLGRIYSKTAALFAAAAESAAVLGTLDKAQVRSLRRYGEKLGLAFQIRDDILDFTADAVAVGKPVGADLRQGTVTLPVLYAAAADHLPLAQALAHQPEAVETVIRAVRDSDALQAAARDAAELAAAAVEALAEFPPSPSRQALEALAVFSAGRPH